MVANADQRLAQLAAEFRHWRAANYAAADLAAGLVDDAGYPAWRPIETLLADLLKNNQLGQLSHEAQVNLLYLIARNWDIGTLIAWLSGGPQLSNVGPLSEAAFQQLARTVARLRHPDYEDAKYQFAACFRKFKTLTRETQEILLELFQATGHEYTQRQALQALAQLGYAGLRQLVQPAWETSSDEHHKIAVLAVIANYLPDPDLLRRYLTLADVVPGQYLADYVRELRQLNR